MKFFRLLFAILALASAAMSAQAATTRYDYSFTTQNGISTSGAYFLWNGSTITGGGGALTGLVSGAITAYNYVANSPWMFDITVGGVTYGVTFGNTRVSGTWYPGAVSYSPSTGTDVLTGITAYTGPTPTAVPEIDGSKLAQAGLLIMALVFLARRAKAIRPLAAPQLA